MHRFIRFLAHASALVGGAVLIVLVAMTTLSILGRSTGIGEITGNYEVLEAGVAFAIFAFLPICQFYGAHATVDVFTMQLPDRATRVIAAFWEIVLAAVIILLIWRLYGGLERVYGNGQTTLFLQFPVWWGYAAAFVAGVIACIVAVYCAAARVIEAAQDRAILPSEHEV
ncbi:TRAP transporter small permease [Sulfitobacter albidus]|uniref:TRAP transporter small permease protein n=1 Tax=Sulfitobacter albidus TaxID=2829501 RepID=A0A975PLX2_9RHOB|nr:TRAP transporter small permease [Sulfitobacter albidus]QUJ75816.1 TRAP transporter small permease [Sulfitobacter albidus]